MRHVSKAKVTTRVISAVAVGALMFLATPALAAGLVHVESTFTQRNSAPTFGPVSATCNQNSGGPTCSFVDIDFTISGHSTPYGKFTAEGTATILYGVSGSLLTPSGAHDEQGNPTGYCAPMFDTRHLTFADGSTLEVNDQGTDCCAGSTCTASPFGQPTVARASTVITGGTGKFKGAQGGGFANSSDGGSGTIFGESADYVKLP